MFFQINQKILMAKKKKAEKEKKIKKAKPPVLFSNQNILPGVKPNIRYC